MKKRIVFLLMIALVLCGCVQSPSSKPDSGSDSLLPGEAGSWPENAYTEGLPVPPGAVGWSMLDPAGDYYAVELTGLDDADYRDYMDQLYRAGFSAVEETEQAVDGQDYLSIGTLLSDGERGISVSYIPNCLVLYISRMD